MVDSYGIRERYRRMVAAADDCTHGQPGGDIVRPWCNTPACPWCRRRHPVHWRPFDTPAPVPANVIPLQATRKLF